MKVLLTSVIILFFGIEGYCQTKYTLSLVYGTAGNSIVSIGIGGPGYQNNGETLYGLNYSITLTPVFGVETGIEYSVDKLTWDYEDAYNPNFTPQKATIQLLSVPVYAKFTFFKYLFANVGLSADFQTSSKYNDIVAAQSGIGFGLGIGGKYVYKKVSVFINPFIKIHKLVAFNNDGGGKLINQGIKVGIGYAF